MNNSKVFNSKGKSVIQRLIDKDNITDLLKDLFNDDIKFPG